MVNARKWMRRHWKDLVVVGAYVTLTVVMTWPLAAQLKTHLPGRGDDLLVHYWNGWRTKRVLTQGGDPYYTDLIFHPRGVSLLYHNISWANIALWLPLEPLVGGVAAFNLVYMLNLTLCGLGMYMLVCYVTRSTGAAFVAGLVHAFWPYRLFEIDHPNLITTQWLPLFLLCLMRIVRENRKTRHALLAALFLALTGYARWQLLIFAAIVAGLYVLHSLWFERDRWDSRVVLALAAVVTISTALMAPSLYPIVRGQLTRDYPEDLFVPSLLAKQTDLLAYVVPPHNHLLEDLFKGLLYADSWDRAWYSNAYLGYVVMLLAVAGVRRSRQMAWFWAGLAVISWLLALGPALRFNKHIYSNIVLPQALAKDLLPIRIMREERRFNMLLALPVAAMVGYGVLSLQHCVSRLVRGRLVDVLFVVLALLVCLDYLQTPVRAFDTEISPFYQDLAADPDRFALLNLPTGRDRSPFYQFCQTIHGKPIVEGSVARPPREAREFVESNPFLVYLRDNRMVNPELPDVSRQMAVLAEADVRYIVMNRQYAFPWEKDDWRAYFAYRPFYEDQFISVYRTDPLAGRDFDLSEELYSGIGLVQVISSTSFIGPASLMEVATVWGTTEPQTEDLSVRLALVDESGQCQQTATFPPVQGWPADEWPANALGHGRYAFRVDPRLPGGLYALTLTLVRSDTAEQVGRAVTLGEALEMALPVRLFTPPPMQVEVDALFGDALRLIGYDLVQGDDALTLTLHWQALRRMDESYKFFVHLYNAESGEMATQADVVPRGWMYPTAWWEAGEVVSDEIAVPLGDVPPGTYRLAVGVYNQDTGVRLPARDASGALQSMDKLVLQEGVQR